MDLIETLRKELGRSIVVKPINQGSAVGVSIVQEGNLDDLKVALKKATEFSDKVLMETYIPGKEVTVSILDNEPLPVIEIKPDEGYYDFTHKYTKGMTQYVCPAELEEHVFAFTQSLSLDAAMACDVSDFARVDLRVTDDGQIFCLEVNTIPGFTELSLFPMAAKETGIGFDDLCEKLIHLGIESFKLGK
jgi:D-alanine-D-alanine ligase